MSETTTPKPEYKLDFSEYHDLMEALEYIDIFNRNIPTERVQYGPTYIITREKNPVKILSYKLDEFVCLIAIVDDKIVGLRSTSIDKNEETAFVEGNLVTGIKGAGYGM